MHIPLRLLTIAAVLLGSIPAASAKDKPPLIAVNVTTYHNDNARTGQYPHETVLTPGLVNPDSASYNFGKKFAAPVDGQVYAQPLYVAGLNIKGKGRHNAAFVATEHDSVYAFDADSGELLWHRSLLGEGRLGVDVTPVPEADLPGSPCGQISLELGITATPVIDFESGTLYVVAMTKETVVVPDPPPANYFHRLHALDIRSGKERPGSPVEIGAAVDGTGDGGAQDIFVPLQQKTRAGLVLANGVVYTFWSSHCDTGQYHGWVIGYDAATLRQTAVFNTTPDGQQGSIWQSGAAPAVDDAGNIFLAVASGTFNARDGGRDFGESYLRLAPTNSGGLRVRDWFAPFNADSLIANDQDISSSGPILFDVNGHRLLAGAGKASTIYLLDRDDLGRFTPGADTGAYQTRPGGDGGLANGLFSTPAFFDSAIKGPTLYFAAVNDRPRAFVLEPDGRLPAAPTSLGPTTFGYPGAVPGISSNGGRDGIAWMIQSNGVLHAYDADDLSRRLYSSDYVPPGHEDSLGSYVKFSTPVIAQGRVYVGTADHLVAYGRLQPPEAQDITGDFNVEIGPLKRSKDGKYLLQNVTLSLKNLFQTIPAPVCLVLDGLTKGASLANATGTTTQTAPTGTFYVRSGDPGSAFQGVDRRTIRLKFVNRKNDRAAWTPRVLYGAGGY